MRASSLKAIVVKELRENLQWALLACIVAMGFLSFGIYGQFKRGESIAGDLFLQIYKFICPAVGLVIGLMQMIPEMRRGRWQFVTHRPISRAALLLVKIFAGIALYVLAAGLPLAIISAWAAAPGHVPGPFAWNMLDEPLRYLCGGFASYAAGLLVGCRRGRWFGSRLIPVIAAAMVYFLPNNLFGTVLRLVVTSLLLAALWGAYMAAGEIALSRWWARGSLALLLLVGWTVLVSVGTSFGETALGINSRWDFDGRYAGFQSRQGISLMDNVWLYAWRFNGRTELSISDRLLNDDRGSIENWQDPDVTVSTSLSDRWKNLDIPWERPVLSPLFAPGETNWFYVGERRSIEGYNRRTNRYLGSISLSGFAGPEAAPQPIPDALEGGPWSRSGRMWFDRELTCPVVVYADAVHHVHFSPPGMQKIFTAAPGDPVITADLMLRAFNDVDEMNRTDNYAAVLTRDRVHIIRGSREVLSIPIDGRSGDGSIAVAKLKTGEFAVAYLSQSPAHKTDLRIVLVYKPDGTRVHRWAFSDNPMSPFAQGPPVDWLNVCASTGFCPLPMFMRIQSIQRKGEGVPLYIVAIVTMALVAAGLSVLIAMSILRSRHATRPQVYLWIIVCAAFGVVGILTMSAILNRMPRLRCATCGRRMLPTESSCVHCATPAAPPKMRGIEILAPGMVLA